MATKKRFAFRYLLIAVVFCAVSLIYVGRLFYIQIAGRDADFSTGTTVAIVKVQAARGEIFDRNGKPLVTNSYTYDLSLSYSSMSAVGITKANRTYLQILSALDVCGASNTHTENYFPLSGTYPNYSFTTDAKTPDSVVAYRLGRILKTRGMKSDATAQDLMNEYVESYRLLETDDDGVRLYTDYEIDRLIRLRYDMDAVGFHAAQDYVFARNTSITLMTYIKEQGLPGVRFAANAERVYNYPGYASHILGSVGPIYSEQWDYYNELGYQMNAIVGKDGCEKAFESYLRGTDGEWRVTIDAEGRIIKTEVLKEPVPGKDVYLTIDIDLQIAAEDSLAENVQYVQEHDTNAVVGYACDSGAAIVMDPSTFEILAIASYPTFDLTTYNRDFNSLIADPARPTSNRTLMETYAPGSTFKLGVAIAGLNEGTITPDFTYPCSGVYTRFDDYQPKCYTYSYGTHGGRISVVKALADSCNTFFYELGYRLGIVKIDSYLGDMGFGRPTGIELGEMIGTLAGEPGSYEGQWQPGDTVQTAIGQFTTRATPLQLCSYVATVANRGTRLSAHLLDRVCELGSDEPIYTDDHLLLSPLSVGEWSDTAYSTVMEAMRQMIRDSNTARNFLSQNGVSYNLVGGKTGTAQFNRYVTDGATGEITKIELTNALFVGVYGESEPELVVSVVLEKASSGTYASYTAAGIFGAWEDIKDAKGEN